MLLITPTGSPFPATPVRLDFAMIAKTLIITSDLFDAATRIQQHLAPEAFMTAFLPRLRAIDHCLSLGPNPDLMSPLLDALEWGFHTPAQPILETIIYAQGFDWRFVTGRRRPFKSLASGQTIPPTVTELWNQAKLKSSLCMAKDWGQTH